MGKKGINTKYNSTYHPKIIELLAQIGKIDIEICKELKIAEGTLINWKKAHPEVLKAIKKGKKQIDDQVTNALLKRALGYDHPDVKVMQYEGQPVIVDITKHILPDVTACIFWLKNRRPAEWRESSTMVVEGAVLEQLGNIMSKKDKKIG